MKFAKELERECVPEWRAKYLDYKQGKKKLKALDRALRAVRQTPHSRHRVPDAFTPSPYETAPKYAFLNRVHAGRDDLGGSGHTLRNVISRRSSRGSLKQEDDGDKSPVRPTIPGSVDPERQPLTADQDREAPLRRYGSIIGSPCTQTHTQKSTAESRCRRPPTLELPEPALDPDHTKVSPSTMPESPFLRKTRVPPMSLPDRAPDTDKASHRRASLAHLSLPAKYKSIFQPKRINSMPPGDGPRPSMRRVVSLADRHQPDAAGDDVPLDAYREVDFRQAEFFNFLDKELDKVETFYKEKEDEATARLEVLREQLHIMRDRRLEEIIEKQTNKMKSNRGSTDQLDGLNGKVNGENGNGKQWLKPIDNVIENALKAAKNGRFGKGTKGMEELATPHALRPQPLENRRDYTRRPELPEVPYRTAKRKLKVALQEYYRGLELLKSYALLNRTAFRKINKKYDKTVNAKPSGRYMSEKVNHAWFVQSDVVDGHIRAVEDLYARYFEQGNHKVAVGKLRVKMARAGDYTDSTFRNGLMLAAGSVFGIEGLVYGAELLFTDDPVLRVRTSYLLQIYGGYFMMTLLMLLFCLVCRFWTVSKINYAFVFEFDTRSHLDWRQLAEIPCFLAFLLGLFMWLNFHRFGGEDMYIYWPVILIVLSLVAIFFPARVLYHRSRKWFLYSNWRLLLAGLYPVEFRDFFLGDMFCSLTYSMGNLELFFCLYAIGWSEPTQCNSSHSRLLGFFSALPGVWRALQCLRRYYDTRNIFPHLVNCGKYTATILYYMSLSLYRLDKTSQLRAVFILFATINAVYCSIWDVIMDWSLGDPYAPAPFLRRTLGYKRVWIYYAAMVLDPILRFNWIFYAIYADDLQHSAVLSFFIALSEVFRRAMWTVFRVENEHCTNVGRFRASRDVPLPYEVATPVRTGTPQPSDEEAPPLPETVEQEQATATATGAATSALRPSRTQDTTLSSASAGPGGVFRRRATSILPKGGETPSPLVRGFSRVGNILHAAHAQDFERRRPRAEPDGRDGANDNDSEDEELEFGDGETPQRFEDEVEREEVEEGRLYRHEAAEEVHPATVEEEAEASGSGSRDGDGEEGSGRDDAASK